MARLPRCFSIAVTSLSGSGRFALFAAHAVSKRSTVSRAALSTGLAGTRALSARRTSVSSLKSLDSFDRPSLSADCSPGK